MCGTHPSTTVVSSVHRTKDTSTANQGGTTVALNETLSTAATPRELARAIDALVRRRATLPATHPDRPRLRQEAVEAGLPMVRRLARRYAGRGEPLPDLEQVAACALLKAVDGFDPTYTTDFWAYATLTILGGLKHHFRDRSWAVTVPRRYKDLLQEINRCRDELTQRLRRPPRIAELAEHLGRDQRDVGQALAAQHCHSSRSLFTPIKHDGSTLIEAIGEPDRRYELVDLHESLHPALAQLPQREQRIIALRFFANMTQAQIAMEVGVSQMHVSRLLARGLRRMRASLADAY